MRYRVAFAKRFQSDGNESSLDPTAEVDMYIPDGVVADKVFVERFEPDSKHNEEVMDEDDAWLGLASAELWEYDVVDSREQDFVDAMENSEMVMEYTVVDEGPVEAGDATNVPLADSGTKGADTERTGDFNQGRSGTSWADEGAGGQPTGDGNGGADDLTVVGADDPNLGLTNFGGKGPDDWAADTGRTKVPGNGAKTK